MGVIVILNSSSSFASKTNNTYILSNQTNIFNNSNISLNKSGNCSKCDPNDYNNSDYNNSSYYIDNNLTSNKSSDNTQNTLNSSFIEIYSRINEVMYDSSDEFIELFVNNTINISYLKVGDKATINQVDCCPHESCNRTAEGFILITSNKSGYANYSNHYCVRHSKIGNGLSNSGDSVILSYTDNQTGIIFKDILNYTPNMGGKKGFSLSYFKEGYGNGVPSPASPNIKPMPLQIDVMILPHIDKVLYTNVVYDNPLLIKIENKEECSIKTNITYNYIVTGPVNDSIGNSKNKTPGSIVINETRTKAIGCSSYADTGLISFNQAGKYKLCAGIHSVLFNDSNTSNNQFCINISVINSNNIKCNVSLNINTEKLIYTNKESIKYDFSLSNKSFPYEIEYWIEDLSGNIVKSKLNTTNTNTKSYTPDIKESDKVLVIKGRILKLFCNNSNNKTSDERIVIIKNDPAPEESSIHIEKVYLGSDDIAKFGDVVRVKTHIYKGNSGKTSVQAYITDKAGNKYSKTTSFNAYDKYKDYYLTLPVQIYPNCKSKYKNGRYYIIVEGLDTSDEESININGYVSNLCQKRSCPKTSCSGTFISESYKSRTKMYDLRYPSVVNTSLFNITVSINSLKAASYKIWAYVYENKKCYSPNRTANLITLNLSASTKTDVLIPVRVVNISSGNYKLMVKIRKNTTKSIYAISREIKIIRKRTMQSNMPYISKISLEKLKDGKNTKATYNKENKIRVIVEVNNTNQSCTLLMLGSSTKIQRKFKNYSSTRKVYFNITASRYPQLVFIKLFVNNKSIASKELVITLNNSDNEPALYYGKTADEILMHSSTNINYWNNGFSKKPAKLNFMAAKNKIAGNISKNSDSFLAERIIYESPGKKAKKLIPYLIAFSSALLCIVIITKS